MAGRFFQVLLVLTTLVSSRIGSAQPAEPPAPSDNDKFINFACEGNIPQMSVLIAISPTLDINSKHTQSGETALTCAAKNRRMDVLEFFPKLTHFRINPNVANKYGETLLTLLLNPKAPSPTLEYLTFVRDKYGSKINFMTNKVDNRTFLHWPLSFEQKRVMITVIHGEALNDKNSEGLSFIDLLYQDWIKKGASLQDRANVEALKHLWSEPGIDLGRFVEKKIQLFDHWIQAPRSPEKQEFLAFLLENRGQLAQLINFQWLSPERNNLITHSSTNPTEALLLLQKGKFTKDFLLQQDARSLSTCNYWLGFSDIVQLLEKKGAMTKECLLLAKDVSRQDRSPVKERLHAEYPRMGKSGIANERFYDYDPRFHFAVFPIANSLKSYPTAFVSYDFKTWPPTKLDPYTVPPNYVSPGLESGDTFFLPNRELFTFMSASNGEVWAVSEPNRPPAPAESLQVRGYKKCQSADWDPSLLCEKSSGDKALLVWDHEGREFRPFPAPAELKADRQLLRFFCTEQVCLAVFAMPGEKGASFNLWAATYNRAKSEWNSGKEIPDVEQVWKNELPGSDSKIYFARIKKKTPYETALVYFDGQTGQLASRKFSFPQVKWVGAGYWLTTLPSERLHGAAFQHVYKDKADGSWELVASCFVHLPGPIRASIEEGTPIRYDVDNKTIVSLLGNDFVRVHCR
jgi:hypothetical protein